MNRVFKSILTMFQKRSFEGATGGRRGRHWGAMPNIPAAVNAGRARVADRARYAVGNNGIAAGAEATWVAETIGSGHDVCPQSGDPALDQIIKPAFNSASDRIDYYGSSSFYTLQATFSRRFFTDGECLAIMGVKDEEFKIKMLDPAQLAPVTSQLPGGGLVVSGVEMNEGGKVIAYHIYKSWLPSLPLLKSLEITRVDAVDIIHLFRPDAAGQVRGISPLTPVMLRLKELDEYTDAEVVRLKLGAMLCGFITDADGTLLEEQPGTDAASLEPGTLQRLRPGESITMAQGPQVGMESNAFARGLIREIGAGCGIPSFMITSDMSEVNFSSARVAIIGFRRRVDAWQELFAHQVLRPIYRRWLTVEILSGRIADVPLNEATLRHKWIAPKSQYLDPLKDAQSESLAISAGLTSRRECVAARGIDVEQLDEEIAQDRAREKALGIYFTPIAQTPTKEPENA